MKNIIIYILIILFVSGCISEFNPEMRNVNDYLIIEAKITDKEGASVKISAIKAGETRNRMLETDAEVEINDNYGGKIILTEKGQGVYSSVTNGIPGHIYTLIIKTSDGNEFNSTPEQMYSAATIDSVYAAFEFHQDFNSREEKPGVSFYFDFNSDKTDCKFFRSTFDETWIEKTPLTWRYYGTYDKNGNLTAVLYWPRGTEHNRKCFHYHYSNEVIIKSTEHLTPGPLKKNSLYFTNDLAHRFSIGYSVIVKQHSLTPDAFLYYKQLQKTSELSGSLYDPIPSFIESNIYNTKDPNQKITGYFVTAGIAAKRIFIHPIEVVPAFYLYNPPNIVCQDSIANTFAEASKFHRFSLDIYDYTPGDAQVPMEIKMTKSECFDCTANQGSVVKPPYWDDRYSGN